MVNKTNKRRAYYQRHRAHIREQQRQYKATHRAEINAQKRERYANDSDYGEKCKLLSKKYREANKEAICKRRRQWYAENRERLRAWQTERAEMWAMLNRFMEGA